MSHTGSFDHDDTCEVCRAHGAAIAAVNKRWREMYDRILEDLHGLGEALGHERVARPESPQEVFKRWTEEVRELRLFMEARGLEKQ